MITRRAFTGLLAAAALTRPSRADPALLDGLKRLQLAYPGFIKSVDEARLLWKDGTAMQVSLFAPGRSIARKISQPDLAAQVLQTYPIGVFDIPQDPPQDPNADPGRIRYDPFFARMYGTTRAAVAGNITRVPWPSIARAPFVLATTVNGVAGHLALVAEELNALPKELHRFFDNPAGGFYWRPIAGTKRLSAHSFGIAVDINTSQTSYWRDELKNPSGEPENWKSRAVPKTRIPKEIVEIFERHGFIWGGKWYHYDTMHFEYRPELLG